MKIRLNLLEINRKQKERVLRAENYTERVLFESYRTTVTIKKFAPLILRKPSYMDKPLYVI